MPLKLPVLKPESEFKERRLRILIVFENRIRQDTTGIHCLAALENICEVTHLLPDQVQTIRTNCIDLYLQVDDGTSPGVLGDLHPSAFWAIDTHLSYERLFGIARGVDHVFCAQKAGALRMRLDGIERATWLPLAANPEFHYAVNDKTIYDVAFIGHIVNEERRAILERLAESFPKNFVGRAFNCDWTRISSQARVLFNKSVCGDLNMRVFESLATGKPLLTDLLPAEAGLQDLFVPGIHLLTYKVRGESDPKGRYVIYEEDFTSILSELLRDPLRLEKLGSQGMKCVLSRHTYRHRMESLICACAIAPSKNILEPFQEYINDVDIYSYDAKRPKNDVASILIACKDGVEFTRECLASILEHTKLPYELILVDNGSIDPTPFLFQDIKAKASLTSCVRVEIIRNKENLGFARAMNQAIRSAQGEFMLLLNNDVVVSDDWLSGLLDVAKSHPSVGLVGPMTNYTAPPQRVDEVAYNSLKQFHEFAANWRVREGGRAEECGRLTGFCLLFKREVFERIGYLDERFGVGFFEDDDFCLRARDAGFLCLIARQVYIHHYGSQTFRLLGLDVQRELDKNYEIFREKWGARADAWKLPK